MQENEIVPYIKDRTKEILEPEIVALSNKILNRGELNYTIMMLILMMLARTDKRYEDREQFLGTLDAVSKEYYRRAVAPYEDEKAKENGDVFEYWI